LESYSSDKAVKLYQQAFDAELVASDPHVDGTFMHAELNDKTAFIKWLF